MNKTNKYDREGHTKKFNRIKKDQYKQEPDPPADPDKTDILRMPDEEIQEPEEKEGFFARLFSKDDDYYDTESDFDTGLIRDLDGESRRAEIFENDPYRNWDEEEDYYDEDDYEEEKKGLSSCGFGCILIIVVILSVLLAAWLVFK